MAKLVTLNVFSKTIFNFAIVKGKSVLFIIILKKIYLRVLEKFVGTGIRVFHAVWLLPIRIMRIGEHIYKGLFPPKYNNVLLPVQGAKLWWLEFVFYCLDVLAVPEMYETITDWVKWKTRGLTQEEKKLARSIYGNSIFYERVRVDETASIVCKKQHIFYVSFFTINSWGTFQPDIFIHELMHIWQFQKLGAVYIPRALLAQRTPQGYNYGGIDKLIEVISARGDFDNFNLEQQADIISDFYCIREGLMPRWCEPYKIGAFEALNYFVKKLSN